MFPGEFGLASVSIDHMICNLYNGHVT